MQAAILATIPCYYISVCSLVNMDSFLTYVIIYFYFVGHEIDVRRSACGIDIGVAYLTRQ